MRRQEKALAHLQGHTQKGALQVIQRTLIGTEVKNTQN